jgi:hypothetical protein
MQQIPKNGIKAAATHDNIEWLAWSKSFGVEDDQPCRIFSEERAKELLRIEKEFYKLSELHNKGEITLTYIDLLLRGKL